MKKEIRKLKVVYDVEYDEFCVKVTTLSNKRLEDECYYTDSKNDAHLTMYKMAKSYEKKGYEVIIINT